MHQNNTIAGISIFCPKIAYTYNIIQYANLQLELEKNDSEGKVA